MTQYDFGMGFAIGIQAAANVPDPTIAALTGSVSESDGAVLGDPESGRGESGIEAVWARDFRDKGVIPGTLTRPLSDFLRSTTETFSIAIPLKGGGATIATAPGADTDYQLAPGVDALLQAAGLAGAAWGGGVGWEYTPASQQICTVKLWKGSGSVGQSWVISDVVCNALSISQTPGEIGIATFTLAGTIVDDQHAEDPLPTFDYGLQGSTSAPTIESVGHQWGAVRGFVASEIAIDNEAEDVPDSNAPGGIVTRQTGRSITNDTQLYADDADVDFEWQELIREQAAGMVAQSWLVGSAPANGEQALAYEIEFPTPELQSMAGDKAGTYQTWDVSMVGRSDAGNGEFALRFR